MKKNIELKPFQITSGIHPMSEIEPCHSCENRNPEFPVQTGIHFHFIVWFPAFAGTESGFPLLRE